MPEADAGAFARWGQAVGAGLGGVRSLRALHRLDAAVGELRALLGGLLERRRHDPADDLLSHLAAQDADADEAVSLAALLLLAGFETTSTLLANAVAAMTDAREPWAQLAADPGRAGDAVEETPALRGADPVHRARRPHETVRLGDRDIAPDTVVMAMLGAAGRDPAVHADPDVFDLDRPTKGEHLAFSGRHPLLPRRAAGPARGTGRARRRWPSGCRRCTGSPGAVAAAVAAAAQLPALPVGA